MDIPKEMLDYEKKATKARGKIMGMRCKNCNKTMEEGGWSGTPGLCATCLRGGE